MYGEQQSEYEEYARRQKAREAGARNDSMSVVTAPASHDKGFGGGEATRDPAPTLDPDVSKGKQAIHRAESYAEYLARRKGPE